jgi:ankyrin repeat protein
MENLCKRFPHLAGAIFDQVDEPSLNICKEISGDVLEFLDNERFFWIRMIKKYQRRLKDFPKLWKPVVDKTSVEKLKEIAIAVSRFFQVRHLYSHRLFVRRRKWSLIAISAHQGDLALLQFIVNKIKLKNIRKSERITALFLAASKGHLEIYDLPTRKLRDKNPGNTSLLNEWGRTPLHWAANNGHFGVCKLIIDGTSNKNPAEIKNDRSTPLHWAAYNGHVEVCKLIMDNITDKNPVNGYLGETPFHCAAKQGHLAVCKLIMDNITDKNPADGYLGETPFHCAAKKGHLAICQLMVENLSDKNPASKANRLTPLHYAADAGHVEICKLIMENLVNKNPSCLNKSTPLSLAMNNGKSEVCQLFHQFKRCGLCKGQPVDWRSPEICEHITLWYRNIS